MSQTCTECGFPMDTPERAHAFIHQMHEALIEHRKALRESTDYAELNLRWRRYGERLQLAMLELEERTRPDGDMADAPVNALVKNALLDAFDAYQPGSESEIVRPQNPAPENSRSEEVSDGRCTPAVVGRGDLNGSEVSRGGTNLGHAVGTAFEGLAHYVPPSYSRILWRGAYLDLPSMQVPSQVSKQGADRG